MPRLLGLVRTSSADDHFAVTTITPETRAVA
jgi:hypothetical protein